MVGKFSSSTVYGQELKQAIDRVLAGQASYKIDTLLIDRAAEPELAYSILVITAEDPKAPDLGVAYHALFLEGSGQPLTPQLINIMGVADQVEVLRTVMNANNQAALCVILEHLEKAFPGRRLFSTDATAVPADFDYKEMQGIYEVATETAAAVTTELEMRRPDFKDINIEKIISGTGSKEVVGLEATFAPEVLKDNFDQPVRSDVRLDLMTRVPPQLQRRVGEVSYSSILKMHGFVNLNWSPVGKEVKYQPEFVITRTDTYTGTIGTQVLSLLPAMWMVQEQRWAQGLVSGLVGDLHNFAATEKETGVSVAGMTEESINRVVRPGLLVSMDVPMMGDITWRTGIFAAAASGNHGANEAILQAAKSLTGGKMGVYSGPVAFSNNNLVHLGYYIDAQGNKRDLREIDYLAVLNLGSSAIEEWSEAFVKQELPLELRLAMRKRIIQALVPSAVFTGFAIRVTFFSAFLQLLTEGCRAAGLHIRTVPPLGSRPALDEAITHEAIIVRKDDGGGNPSSGFSSRW